jgi:hypothetical protein
VDSGRRRNDGTGLSDDIGISPQTTTLVTPAQAGVQSVLAAVPEKHWIPACAGMTA